MNSYAVWCEKHGTKEDVQKYYLMAIDHDHVVAMNNYAVWSEKHGTKSDVKKYYLMSIECKCSVGMNNYARWCEKHGTNDDVKKYYLLAIEHGCIIAMKNYALWCKKNGTKSDVKKYYLMAIEHDHVNAMYWYAVWCYEHNDPDYKKYFILGCKNNQPECRLFINEHFVSLFLDDINDVYDYLTDENKSKVQNLIVKIQRITNINIISESLCLTCQTHTKCLFLHCGHPQCFKCWLSPCILCGPLTKKKLIYS